MDNHEVTFKRIDVNIEDIIRDIVKQCVNEYMESKKLVVVNNSTITIKEPFDFADVANQISEVMNSRTISGN